MYLITSFMYIALIILNQPSKTIQEQFQGYYTSELYDPINNPRFVNESILKVASEGVYGREQYERYCMWHNLNLPCSTKCQRNSRCGSTPFPYKDNNNTFRDLIIEHANRARSMIAQGDPDYGLPPAANLLVLSYSRECEFFAACYLKTCHQTDVSVKIAVKYGNFLGGTGYGIISFKENQYRIGPKEIEDAFLGWRNTSHGPNKTPPINKVAYMEAVLGQHQAGYANDFLQLANAGTHAIGCATSARRLDSNLMYYQLFCVYLPAIKLHPNVEVYKPGKPASECADHKIPPNDRFPLLCGTIYDNSLDWFIPFVNLNRSQIVGVPCIISTFWFVIISLLYNLYQ